MEKEGPQSCGMIAQPITLSLRPSLFGLTTSLPLALASRLPFPNSHRFDSPMLCYLPSVHPWQNDALIAVADSPHNQSVATMVAGDKVAFYHCAFYSLHNTLFDYKGRHYYESSYIQGNIDFIFGRGQSIFQESVCCFRLTQRMQYDHPAPHCFLTNECRVVRSLCCMTRESRYLAPSLLRTGRLQMTAVALSSSKARCTGWETRILVGQRGLTLVSSLPKLISPGPSQLQGGLIGVMTAAQSKHSHHLLVRVTEWMFIDTLVYSAVAIYCTESTTVMVRGATQLFEFLGRSNSTKKRLHLSSP